MPRENCVARFSGLCFRDPIYRGILPSWRSDSQGPQPTLVETNKVDGNLLLHLEAIAVIEELDTRPLVYTG
jgi:hypothetical protein